MAWSANLHSGLGVGISAKAKLSDQQLSEMKQKRADGVLIKNLMSEYALSKASVYRLLSNDTWLEISFGKKANNRQIFRLRKAKMFG